MKLTLILWDEAMEYEIKELAKLFYPVSQIDSICSRFANHCDLLQAPGFAAWVQSASYQTILWMNTHDSTGVHVTSVNLAGSWKQDPAVLKTAKRHVKRRAYHFFQSLNPQSLPWGTLTGVRPVKLAHQLQATAQYDSARLIQLLQTEYLISPKKSQLLSNIASVQQPFITSASGRGVHVYVGIPLCPGRCSYCSFVSRSVRPHNDPLVQNYLQALTIEIQIAAEIIDRCSFSVESLYIGGGTPSILSLEQITHVMRTINTLWPLNTIPEITFEAGRPDTLSENKLHLLHETGIHRLSINPQTFHNQTLERIKRQHSIENFYNAWHLAQAMNFPVLNLDVIIGLPGENTAMMEETIDAAIELNPQNLTVHSLAVKRGAVLAENPENKLANGREAEKLMDDIYRKTAHAGLHPYYLYRQKRITGNLENVGFSLPGKESLYNMMMMEEKQHVIGIGAGAVSRQVDQATDRIRRIPNVKDVLVYIQRINDLKHQYRLRWQEFL